MYLGETVCECEKWIQLSFCEYGIEPSGSIKVLFIYLFVVYFTVLFQ
jgi:hypothetical protein